MHIIKASDEPKDNIGRTHLEPGQTFMLLTADDLNSDGTRFRGWTVDVIMMPKEFKKVYIHFPAWKVLEPALKKNASIKFY